MAAPPPLPHLMDELKEEILLRIPPDDPASLLRAALVCKRWHRLVCGAAFRRRYLEFHRTAPPLLGVLRMPTAIFVPTSSFRPVRAAARNGQLGWHALDARHGRVLICRRNPSRHGRPYLLSVWDPATDELRDLPKSPIRLDGSSTHKTAAVACAAAAAAGGNCDHPEDCRREPFLVVAMEITTSKVDVYVYTSDAVVWSKVAVFERPAPSGLSIFKPAPAVVVRSALYFLVHFGEEILNDEIVEYDLATREVSMIRLPYRIRRLKRCIVLMTDDGGGLGFVANVKDKLELWSRLAGPDEDAGFVLTRIIDLRKVLPSGTVIKNSTQVIGFADSGASQVVFIRMSDGLYSIEINSSKVKKVDNYCGDKDVVPYIGFCTPTSKVQH